jgi:NtrC-family two-component system sensor histidine kinase KinB
MKKRAFRPMLRTRMFASLLPLVVVLLAMGVYAIVLFSRLANSVNDAVNGHHKGIFAAEVMSQSLAGMGREAPAARDTRIGDNKIFQEYQKGFEEGLATQRQAATSPGLQDLTEQLSTNYSAFLASLTAPEAARSPRDLQGEQARRNFSATVARMNALLQKIREDNYQAVLATSNNIQQSARDVTRLMLVGMVLVLLISAYTIYQLGRSILRPIQLLTRATRELGEGNPAQPVPVVSHDELGELAVAFNTMASQLENYRRNTSEEIVRLHRTTETMLASFPDPIFVLDRDGQIELKNPAAAELAAALQLNGRLPDRLQEVAGRALDSGKDFLPHSFDEVVSYRVHGTEKFFLPRILAMHDKSDELLGVAVVLYDVTRFRLLDSAKTNLVATVSHELNTPLTSVRMALHLLLEKSVGPLTPKQDVLLRTARNDTERLLRILYDLLDLARLDAGNDGLRKERVAPTELLRGIIEDTADKVSSRGLRLKCTVEPNLPPVAVDRQRISHVFTNLMANAIKYSPAGGEILLLATRAEEDGVAFSVADQGPGISEEYHARIFDRFFRAPGQTKTGAGLGLSIAREITVAHGGRIGVKSAPGHGSTFVVVLKADGA